MERVGTLPPGLAALALTSALVLASAGCVAGDQRTAGLEAGDDRPLPTATSTSNAAADPADDGESSGGTDDAEGTDDASSTTEPPETAPAATLPPLAGLAAEPVASGFDQPILVTGAPGTDALFVVEREGLIWTVEDGVRSDEPFLDVQGEINSNSIEQGLLGLVFHPRYEDNGRVFTYWTDVDGHSVVAEHATASPTELVQDSAQVILRVDQPAERHNAGMMAFGPDGLLYVAVGDGGSGGSTAQDTSNLLGSVLRLDVSEVGGYRIPAGNPFGDEIWVYGLRNPWRFSIDPVDELLYVGDVGQDDFEEINVVSLAGAGTNFGWFETEGDRCFRPGCDVDDFTLPVLQYGHDEGCSVTGGWVYRGEAVPELHGHYFFGDWCEGFVRSFRFDDGAVTEQRDWTEELGGGQITSFGVDNRGELLVATWEGEIFKVVAVR